MIHNLNLKHGTRVTDASPSFLAVLQERNWEGNVRELRNIVERAVILAGEGMIRPTVLPQSILTQTRVVILPEPAVAPTPEPGTIPVRVGATIEEAEQALIEATLEHAGMNKTRAAAILGITAKTLHVKLRQYHLASGETNPEVPKEAGGGEDNTASRSVSTS